MEQGCSALKNSNKVLSAVIFFSGANFKGQKKNTVELWNINKSNLQMIDAFV